MYPLPPAPSLAAVNPTAYVLGFTWSAQPGLSYQVQYKTNLLQAEWINLVASVLATNWQMQFVDSPSTNSERFYRVVVLP